MEPVSSQPPRLDYATATTPAAELPLLPKLGHAFAIIWGTVIFVFGVAIVAWNGASSDLSWTDGLILLAAAAAGGWIVVLTWLAFERCSRSASLMVALLATIGTIALIISLLPLACSYESWKDALLFADFAVFLPFTTGVAAYGHWHWAKLLRQPVQIVEPDREHVSQDAAAENSTSEKIDRDSISPAGR